MFCCSECFKNTSIKKYILENPLGKRTNCPYCGSKNVTVVSLKVLRDFFIRCIEKAYTMDKNVDSTDDVPYSISEIITETEDTFSDITDSNVLLRDIFVKCVESKDTYNDNYIDIESVMFYVKSSPQNMQGSTFSDVWNAFKYESMHFNRYFDYSGEDRTAYLFQLNQYLKSISIEVGTTFYRARQYNYLPNTTDNFDSYAEIGPPPAESIKKENRMSPAGIPYLYLASDMNTALAECYNEVANVLVGSFITKRNIKVVDLSNSWRVDRMSIYDPHYCHEDHWINHFLSNIVSEISQPVDKSNDCSYDYSLTQLVAEYLRTLGYDGICYNSCKGNGKNYVFFYGPKSNDIYSEFSVNCHMLKHHSLPYFAEVFDITNTQMLGNILIQYRCPEWVYYRKYGNETIVYNTELSSALKFNAIVKHILDEFKEYHALDEVASTIVKKYDFSPFSTKEATQKIIEFEQLLIKEKLLVKKNILRDGQSKEQSDSNEPDILENQLMDVMFELTYRCQERCRYCYCVTDNPTKEELSTEEVIRVLDELKEMNVQGITFTGGDPFMRKDFYEILEHAHKNGFLTTIFTNGVSLSDSDILHLKALHIKDIHFSIYSNDPEKHDYFTQRKGSFDKTISAIKKCVLIGIPVNIKTTVLSINSDDLEEILKLAEDLGTTIQVALSVMPTNEGDLSPVQYRLSSIDEYVKAFEKIDRHVKSSNHNSEEFSDYRDQICSTGKSSVCINPYGDVFPCNALLVNCGNIRNDSIESIWSNSETLKTIRKLRFSMINECSNCQIKRYCSYCPGEALTENGDLHKKYSEACSIARAREITINQKKGG